MTERDVREQRPASASTSNGGSRPGNVAAFAGTYCRRGRQYVEQINDTFTPADRRSTTILVGGLTLSHDQFVAAAFRACGFRAQALDTPDNKALRLGREYGNRGQCNPGYYMVGNLIKFLTALREQRGLSAEQIVDSYVFLTAGACGPCRFGTYASEYRKALRDSGFAGFRVLFMSQTAWLRQTVGTGGGLSLKPRLTIRILLGLLIGDVLNSEACRIRPYETRPGETDGAIARCRRHIVTVLEGRGSLVVALRRCHRELSAIEVDRTEIRPRVAVIGEFWAMTTEGDGNYRLQRFLEQEGAEVDAPSVTAWLLYLNWTLRYDTRARMRLQHADDARRGLKGVNVRSRLLGLWLARKALTAAFKVCSGLIGSRGHQLPDMDELAKISHRFYDGNNRGGEGHMEVGKLIMNAVSGKVDLTVSVKPFGCLPSSVVSDGVQSSIAALYPRALFLPVETSGDGAGNVYSRLQMQLSRARELAQREFREALQKTGQTQESFQRRVDGSGIHRRALHQSRRRTGCTAADLVYEASGLRGR